MDCRTKIKGKGNGKPRIGVTTSVRGGTLSWWFNRLAVWRAGGKAVRLTAKSRQPHPPLDGLIVGGGDDIDPQLYGETVEFNIRIDEKRDQLEQAMLAYALEKGIPVLGICRGAQMINIHLGGSLHTNIHEVYEEAPRMRTVLPRKKVTVQHACVLYRILRQTTCRVNCLHHQSIDRLGEDLNVVARDDYDIIQAVESASYPFLIGVQWHPEYLPFDRNHQRLFKALVRQAAAYAGALATPNG